MNRHHLLNPSSSFDRPVCAGGHSVRSDIAKHLMAGLLAQSGKYGSDVPSPSAYIGQAAHAVAAADALIAALNKTPPSSGPS